MWFAGRLQITAFFAVGLLTVAAYFLYHRLPKILEENDALMAQSKLYSERGIRRKIE